MLGPNPAWHIHDYPCLASTLTTKLHAWTCFAVLCLDQVRLAFNLPASCASASRGGSQVWAIEHGCKMKLVCTGSTTKGCHRVDMHQLSKKSTTYILVCNYCTLYHIVTSNTTKHTTHTHTFSNLFAAILK